MGQRQLRQPKGADDVDLQDLPEEIIADGVEVVMGDHLGEAGVVDEDVQPTESLDRLLDERWRLRGIAHVGLDIETAGQGRGDVDAGLARR